MLKKHIKAVSLGLTLCIIAVMFLLVAVFNFNAQVANSAGSAILLLFVVATGVCVFAAHEKHQ